METKKSPSIKELLDKAKQLPLKPGVYLMKDNKEAVIYVGKAKALKNRVSSYFQKQHGTERKTAVMVSKVYDIDRYNRLHINIVVVIVFVLSLITILD